MRYEYSIIDHIDIRFDASEDQLLIECVLCSFLRVESTLQSLGWRKLEDRYDESFKLKWVECKSQIDYSNFREGKENASMF